MWVRDTEGNETIGSSQTLWFGFLILGHSESLQVSEQKKDITVIIFEENDFGNYSDNVLER